jgi:FSR family fosmidomycin resistance protein-like MFS transporter
MAAGESARTIGPIIAAGVISVWGLEGIWKLTPLGIITSIYLYFKLKDYKSEFNTSFKKENIKLAIAKTSSFFKKLTLFVLFNYTSKFSISLFLPLYLTKKGFSIESASIAYGILQGFGILGSFSAGRISDKIGRAKTLFIFSLFSAIFLFLFLGFSNIWLLSFLGFFLFAQSPILLALVHDIKTDAPTFINSIYMAINFGISSIIVLLSGFIAQKIGLELTFYISALLTFLSAFLALRLN